MIKRRLEARSRDRSSVSCVFQATTIIFGPASGTASDAAVQA